MPDGLDQALSIIPIYLQQEVPESKGNQREISAIFKTNYA